MTDIEALGAAVTIWLAVVLLTLAGDYASSVRVVNREKPSGVEGHADEPKREAYGERDEAPNRTIPSSPYVRGFAAERERRQRMEPALAGIKPGLGFSRFTTVPGAIPPRESVGGAQGSNTIQSVGIANDGPGDTSPSPGPFAAESGRAVRDRSQSGTRGISPDREAARPLAVTRQD